MAKGWKIDIISGDHQNKPDVGSNIARQWFDVDKVDTIVDVPNSGVALAVNNIVKEKNGVYINSGAARRISPMRSVRRTPCTGPTTPTCSPIHRRRWSRPAATAGSSSPPTTPSVHALERDTSEVVKSSGGKVVGGVKHPLNTADFSSFLLQAQSSKAKVIGLANAGGDTTNSIKQAAEFGIAKGGQKLAALLLFITDVKAIGLKPRRASASPRPSTGT
jgi:branched-chain amino acid transport system substrate-binding protein